MANTIPTLWPESFNVDVLTPLVILKAQAAELSRVTHGILTAEVESENDKENVQHRLVVIAPKYRHYRHTLLAVIHNLHLVYPAEVKATALGRKVKQEGFGSLMLGGQALFTTVYPIVSSDIDLLEKIQEALYSGHTRAIILSLIAKSNEESQTIKTASAQDFNLESTPPGSEINPETEDADMLDHKD